MAVASIVSSKEVSMDMDLVRRAQEGECRAREKLWLSFDGMIRSVARNYAAKLDGTESFDDLLQVGRVGFLEAADRFDSSIAPAFIPYVKEGVRMAIREYLSSSLRLIRIPRSAISQVKVLSEAYKGLSEEGISSPGEEELMAATGFSARMLRNAERNRALQMPRSLDYAYDEEGYSLSSSIASDSSVEEDAESDILIGRLSESISRLSRDDRFIINSLYGSFGSKKLKAAEIAARLSLSETAVRRRARLIEGSLYRMIS